MNSNPLTYFALIHSVACNMQSLTTLSFFVQTSFMLIMVVGYSRDIFPHYKELSCNKSEFFQVETLSCAYCDTHKNLKPALDSKY